jgi:hypothetical protein
MGRRHRDEHGRADTYGYDEADLEWFDRFTLTPVAPSAVRDHTDESLETLDIPSHLGRQLVVEIDPGAALYRLVQLFGTPNAPGFEAGGVSRERTVTTWQYLFEVNYEPREDEGEDTPTTFLLSVYDYKTDVSTGVSGWNPDIDEGVMVLDPVGNTNDVSLTSIPDDEFLEGVVQLVLNMVEEPVPATHEQLWV